MADELAEINGIKPNVWLEDGEEKEVGSASSKSVYKIKRTLDHYYCTCPAWRNQSGVPVNARSCKHIKSLLGEKYEAARLLLKNPDGPAPKSAKGAKAPPKAKAPAKAAAKAPAKRKKPVGDEDEMDEDEDEEGEEDVKPPPAKKARKPASTGAATKGKGKGKGKKVEDDEMDDEMDVDDEAPKKKPQSKAAPTAGDDELAEIDGIKPNIVLADGENHEIKSLTSKAVYKVKRTFDHFYCTCPAWRNQSGLPVNARTCKHLQSLLGEEYETARLKLKNPGGPAPKAAKGAKGKANAKPALKKGVVAAKPASAAKKAPAAVKRKRGAEEDDDEKRGAEEDDDDDGDDDEKEDEDEEEDEKPAKRTRKPVSKPVSKPSSAVKEAAKGKGKAKNVKEEDEDEGMEAIDEDEDGEAEAAGGEAKLEPVDGDELAVIDGIKPKVVLNDGDEREVKSMSSNSVYKIKRTWDHYYCTCPAWRNQGGYPVNARTCKHLQSLLGDKYEIARLKLKNPDGPPPKGAKAKPASKVKAKASAKKKQMGDEEDEGGEGDDDDDDDGEAGGSGKNVPELLLAIKWDIEKGPDPEGWWISEKLDGVRTFYDGKQMISRLGNPFTPPQWFLDKLPKDVTLDGELFGGRGQFQSTVSIVKTINSPHWKGITFQIFDIPSRASEPFEDRVEFLKKLFGEGGTHATEQVCVVEHEVAKSREHVLEKLKEIEALGGEGLMLRKPASEYEGYRSNSLMKVKTFYDAEAVVTGYMPGKGRNAGTTGALKCKMESGKTFNVGTGLNDKQRKNPPKVGAIVVYRFQELTRDGVPRFPSYVGEAVDKVVAKDAEIPEHRRAGAKPADG